MSQRFKLPSGGDVPPAVAARRLALTLEEFAARWEALRERGFPAPDPTTGNFDLDAIDAWRRRRNRHLFPQDQQARLIAGPKALDATTSWRIGWRGLAVGDVTIHYYVTKQRKGRPKWGYWQPCLARPNPKTGKFEPTLMALLGFKIVDCGVDGPLAWAKAAACNARWIEARAAYKRGETVPPPVRIEIT